MIVSNKINEKIKKIYDFFLYSGIISMTVQSQKRKFLDLVGMRQAITPLLTFYSTKEPVIHI